MQTTINRETIIQMTKQANDAGKLIEAGWLGLRLIAVPKNASATQVSEMRKAFFAGAQHLFSSIICVLDGGQEATGADLRRMTRIHEELEQFLHEFKEENLD